jgi:ATP-dependent RNA helicase RhlE
MKQTFEPRLRDAKSHSSQTHVARNRKKQGRKSSLQKKTSTIDPNRFIHNASVRQVESYSAPQRFDDMPLSNAIKKALKTKGFEYPSEIQDKTIKPLTEGRDLLGIAQTGTGKTAAFLIPIIEQLLKQPKRHYALVVVPTRELALQVEQEYKSLTTGMQLHSSCFIGGTNINKDLQSARKNSHIVIATPGRLLDLVSRKAINLSFFHTLVLDEFDRMLDMGFVHDVKRIIAGMSQRKQSLLFSATLDHKQQSLIDGILTNPAVVKVSEGNASAEHIQQDIIRLEKGVNKFGVLCEQLQNTSFVKVILFEETKHKVNRLCKKLNKAGIEADQIHGNKSQNARQNALHAFKTGRVRVLVATDVAARGIDVSDVSHVINYQAPASFDSYIHRIGRTGRAGKTGMALTFIDNEPNN